MGRSNSKTCSKTDSNNSSKADDRCIPVDTPELLILGTCYSGKTILAHRLTHVGFSEEERQAYIDCVVNNTRFAMTAILRAMKQLGIEFEDKKMQGNAELAISRSSLFCDFFSDEESQALKRLWSDASVQMCVQRSGQYQHSESPNYFLSNLERTSTAEYLPTDVDIWKIRTKTTGICPSNLKYMHLDLTVVDVGGARSERKKWIHAFTSNVAVVIFCVALSEYNQVLLEDEETNRMQESLKLFELICKNALISHLPMILLFTKKDVLAEKIKQFDLKTCFEDYTGGNTYDEAYEFIRMKFQNIADTNKRKLTVFCACLTDPEDRTPFSILEYVVDTVMSK